MSTLHRLQLEPLVARALEEDWGHGDWTTDLCVPESARATAKILTRKETVVSGLEVVETVFHLSCPEINIRFPVQNGDLLAEGTVIAEIAGPARGILRGERVALNFLARMCGISSCARAFVEAMEGTGAQLLDTRKTTPGLRLLEKHAAALGGSRNHRFGLCDGVIVKENHIVAAGGIATAVERLLESLPPTIKIEVETTNLDEVEQALDAGADIIMLDNMDLASMREAVALVQGRAYLEASGNVRLNNVRDIALTGVDFISTSAIISTATWADLSLLFDSGERVTTR